MAEDGFHDLAVEAHEQREEGSEEDIEIVDLRAFQDDVEHTTCGDRVLGPHLGLLATSAMDAACAEARLLSVALRGEDPAAIDVACAEAEDAGLSIGSGAVAVARERASSLREAQSLGAVVRSTELLVSVVNTGDPLAIERACREAVTAGVSSDLVVAARRVARQMQEASLLAVAVQSSDPMRIEREVQNAMETGMDEGMVMVARQRARQLREARLLSAAVSGMDASEIEEACEEAASAGVSEHALLAARRRIRELREEQMLALAVQGGDASTIDRACDEAEESGVGERVVAAVRQRAQQLRVARQLQSTMRDVVALRELEARVHAVTAEAADREAVQQRVNVESVFAAGRIRARQIPVFAAHSHNAVEAQCTICFDALRPGEDFLALPCRHAFHCGCVESWICTQGTCPNCRLRVDADDGDQTHQPDETECRPQPDVEW